MASMASSTVPLLFVPRPIRRAGVDVHRSFTLDDTDDELRAFLETAGFLHVRGVFTPEQMAGQLGRIEPPRAA